MQDTIGTPPTGPPSDARIIGKIARVVINDFTYLHPRYRIWILSTLIRKLLETSPDEIDSIHDLIHDLTESPHDNSYDGFRDLL